MKEIQKIKRRMVVPNIVKENYSIFI